MQLTEGFDLTPALSPRRGRSIWLRLEKSLRTLLNCRLSSHQRESRLLADVAAPGDGRAPAWALSCGRAVDGRVRPHPGPLPPEREKHLAGLGEVTAHST